MYRLKEIKNIVKYGIVDYNNLIKGAHKSIHCPICNYLYDNWNNNICPNCGFELEFAFDILYPDEPSPSNGDISLNVYKEQYKVAISIEAQQRIFKWRSRSEIAQ